MDSPAWTVEQFFDLLWFPDEFSLNRRKDVVCLLDTTQRRRDRTARFVHALVHPCSLNPPHPTTPDLDQAHAARVVNSAVASGCGLGMASRTVSISQ